jgi:cell division inhibitor SepF
MGARTMAGGLIDKLTNFLMPVEETVMTEVAIAKERKAHLRLQHAQSAMKVYVGSPVTYDDVKIFADYLKINTAVIVNFELVDDKIQQRINDFLGGLCFITGGTTERISDNMLVYVPADVEINKELYSYAVPTYSKR